MQVSATRRQFLRASGFVCLSFGIPLDTALSQEPARLPGDLQTNRRLSAWLRIESDHTITLMVGKVELGQGILTAVTQVCAEELDVEIGQIKVISGDTSLVPNEGVTAGSLSMPYCATAVRHASAEVRAILLGLAAEKWGRPVEGLTVQAGVIQAPDGARLRYGDLVVGQALNQEATGKVALKPVGEHRYIGRSVQRSDIFHKVMGHSIFVQEMRLPGMLHAQVVRPPAPGGQLIGVEVSAVQRMPGVVSVVRNGSFLGVVAERVEIGRAHV